MSEKAQINESWHGIERDNNKDDVYVFENGDLSLYVVFDGVSTTKDARILIDIVKGYLDSHVHELNQKSLSELFYDANVYSLSHEIGDGASTYVALLIDSKKNTQTISWLGDSRIYGFIKDDQIIKRLTKDHSLEEEPNVITKGLGFDDMVRNDFEEKIIDLEYGFLLCTDGFYEFFEDDGEDMLDIILLKNSKDVQEGFETIVAGSNTDDATYMLVQ